MPEIGILIRLPAFLKENSVAKRRKVDCVIAPWMSVCGTLEVQILPANSTYRKKNPPEIICSVNYTDSPCTHTIPTERETKANSTAQ